MYNHFWNTRLCLFNKIYSFLPDPLHLQIYIARQEHLWEDWKQINVQLGQPKRTIVLPNQSTSSIRNTTLLEIQKKLPVSRDLNAVGRMYLCHALQREYELYFWFLGTAKNLGQLDLQDAAAKAKRNCPVLNIDELVEKSQHVIEDGHHQQQRWIQRSKKRIPCSIILRTLYSSTASVW